MPRRGRPSSHPRRSRRPAWTDPRGRGPPGTSRWGAATPGMDAIHTLYGPLVRDLVPSGCTVGLIARNPYLADEYELAGFLFRPASKRKLSLTLPRRGRCARARGAAPLQGMDTQTLTEKP